MGRRIAVLGWVLGTVAPLVACDRIPPEGRLVRPGQPFQASGGASSAPVLPTISPTSFQPPPPPADEPCEFAQALASDVSANLGETVRFARFIRAGILAQLSDGEHLVLTLPDFAVLRMPSDGRSLGIRSAVRQFFLACSTTECAILEPDPDQDGYLRRLSGGSVPGGALWSELYATSFLLCVSAPEGEALCFDRSTWERVDGGLRDGSTADASNGGALDASHAPARDASVRDATTGDTRLLEESGGAPSDAARGSADAAAAPGRDAGSLPTGDARAPAIDAATHAERPPRLTPEECSTPIYCAGEARTDPLCYYYFDGPAGLYGVTLAGRMIEGSYDDASDVAQCRQLSPALGRPVGISSGECGLTTHVVLLTEAGLYESCGCVLD